MTCMLAPEFMESRGTAVATAVVIVLDCVLVLDPLDIGTLEYFSFDSMQIVSQSLLGAVSP